ncbi:hypothetical protein CkaCkLH20_05687 [Colletotrichum karsti]|uniref:FAD-binding PCMH-type domain-containing protein n=1 Tax=Colletotrichum karsti TaxID=1095194 RepID=A0A9P6LL41_9PEZI|nr:uncharacterized protein CkaCkLH20_05687 [Colletotrichum karsti]KAF9876841.1 hypothetical protein CkaCkLH20_05687 [Colletotrichum karsti]
MPRLKHTPLLISALLITAVAASNPQDVISFCNLLSTDLPDRVSFPESVTYDESISSYYSGQERDIQPGCIFRPKSAEEVSRFIKLVNAESPKCSTHRHPLQFAIRSGGHMIWPGSANIHDGITVDLRELNSVTLAPDKSSASLGTGGVWTDIYPQLVPHNLTVMGGRVTGIGVGGLALGGGIHYLARRHGWVCDNIHTYELVLASGEIIEATASTHADLWLALKGGSNNFGIVTRVDVPTYAMRDIDFMRVENFDAAADMGMTVIFEKGSFVVGDVLYNVEPVENPGVYRAFTAIQPQIAGSLRIGNASSMASEADGLLPQGTTRAIDIVYSFKNGDPDVYSELFRTWEEGAKPLSEIEGLQLVLLIQPHPVTNGTNSLGLKPGQKDEVLSVLTAANTNREDDATVQAGMQSIIDAHRAILKERGLLIPFQYLNYADVTQYPIGSYGAEIKARLQTVSEKYDPDGFFQEAVPGGFKLF